VLGPKPDVVIILSDVFYVSGVNFLNRCIVSIRVRRTLKCSVRIVFFLFMNVVFGWGKC